MDWAAARVSQTMCLKFRICLSIASHRTGLLKKNFPWGEGGHPSLLAILAIFLRGEDEPSCASRGIARGGGAAILFSAALHPFPGAREGWVNNEMVVHWASCRQAVWAHYSGECSERRLTSGGWPGSA